MRPILLTGAAALALLTAACDGANDNGMAADVDTANLGTESTINAMTDAMTDTNAMDGATKPVGAATVTVAEKAPFGPYLVDASGRSLYVLEGAKAAAGLQKCTGGCLDVWPPLFSDGAPKAGDRIDAGKLSTVDRDGRQQVTYGGWPLYYYQADTSPGSTAGQDRHDAWGEWYLLSPDGTIVEAEG